ncbi:uncharacterized protein [Aegilops tauschii subsp. strangulata]|uniref:uncharacterized protein n=1 Tax=Aegilops tauschii subsp. strangulata TaxID=200361 RepID=UPI003CC88161
MRKWLPTAEFWYNTTHHYSLDTSPFQALYGHEPNPGGLPSIAAKLPAEAGDDLDWATHNNRLHAQLARAQNMFKQKDDKKRTEHTFMVSEQVLLKLQPYVQLMVANRLCPKLAYKFFGPFDIVRCIRATAYKLKLPEDSHIHPVFHVSQLKPYTPNYSPVFSEIPRMPDLTGALL